MKRKRLPLDERDMLFPLLSATLNLHSLAVRISQTKKLSVVEFTITAEPPQRSVTPSSLVVAKHLSFF